MRHVRIFFLVLCLIFIASSAFGAMSDEEFVELCRSGSAEKIEEALEGGAFIEAYKGHWTPILMAAYSNPDPKVIELLAEFGADVNKVASDYLQVFNYGSDYDSTTMYECMPTPLMLAAYCNPNPEVVRALVDAGANVNIMTGYKPSERGYASPLYWALRRPLMKSQEKTEAIQNTQNGGKGLLLSAGNNKSGVFDDSDPRTVIVKILINAGADVNARYTKAMNNGTALMMAKTLPVVNALIEAGADVNAKDSRGYAVLYYALFGSADSVAAILDAGADINVKTENGSTPFMLAINDGANPEAMILMIDRGVDINTQDTNGTTLLMDFAGRENINPELINLLLDKGANAKITDKNGKRAIDFARQNRKLSGTTALRRLVKESR